MKLATGLAETTQVPAFRVDSHICVNGKLLKSSKNTWGMPLESITMSENSVLVSEPLTSAGRLKGCPGPAECDSRIPDPNAGTVAVPSVHGALLQNNV